MIGLTVTAHRKQSIIKKALSSIKVALLPQRDNYRGDMLILRFLARFRASITKDCTAGNHLRRPTAMQS